MFLNKLCIINFRSKLINFETLVIRKLQNNLELCERNNVKYYINSPFDSNHDDVLSNLKSDMLIYNDFITEDEENNILRDVENDLKRLKYEYSHWDDAIHGYREIEKSRWRKENKPIIERLQKIAFHENCKWLSHTHVLDLEKDGWIKPHVDSIKFCGHVIAGVSLLSSSVMRLISEADKTKFANVLLPRRSLYVMKNDARYNYSHAILKNTESEIRGEKILKDRRISIICRTEPV